MSLFDSSDPIVTRGSRVSRAPQNHILPTFLNLSDISTSRDFFLDFNLEQTRKICCVSLRPALNSTKICRMKSI